MIVIIDYGCGNSYLKSIQDKLRRIDIDVRISSRIDIIENSEKLILCCGGAFGHGIKKLIKSEIIPILNKKVLIEKTPILGICLGVQLFTKWSEEGNANGLGWLDTKTHKFEFNDNQLKIPHIGWHSIKIVNESPLLKGLDDNSKFYFSHSYHLSTSMNKENIIAKTTYGYDFPSIIQCDNIFGTQFHPEIMNSSGIKILRNFERI